MKDFLLIFRAENNNTAAPTPEQMEASMKSWIGWLNGIGEQGKLTDMGSSLHASGKVLKPDNVVTNGPYMEVKESVGGYSIVKAGSYDEAVELAKGCPIFQVGGNVEIRELVKM